MTAGTPAPAGYETLDLGSVPPLGQTYRTVMARSARAVLSAPSGGLPARALTATVTPDDVAHLAAYQRLVGARVGDELPAGYVHVLGFPLAMALMARADFPLAPLGMVHVANRIEQVRPVRLGEEVGLTAWAHGAREHRRGTTVELEVAAEVAGEVVWTGRSTYLSKGAVPPVLSREPAPGERTVAEIPAHAQALWNVSPAEIHTYAQVSGDRNPIHTSRLGARAFGFSGRIAHGMYTAARALHTVRLPAAFTWDVQFASPLPVPGKAAFAQVRGGVGAFGASPEGVREESRSRNGSTNIAMMVWLPRQRKTHLTATLTPLERRAQA
ncbi:MAG: MaoC/PaaZ C-terminal domain-containing protein [Actinomycetaceae bacterium]